MYTMNCVKPIQSVAVHDYDTIYNVCRTQIVNCTQSVENDDGYNTATLFGLVPEKQNPIRKFLLAVLTSQKLPHDQHRHPKSMPSAQHTRRVKPSWSSANPHAFACSVVSRTDLHAISLLSRLLLILHFTLTFQSCFGCASSGAFFAPFRPTYGPVWCFP